MARPDPSLRTRLTRLADYAVAGAFFVAILPLLVLPVDRATALGGWIGRTLLPRLPVRRRMADNFALVKPGGDLRTLAAAVGDCFGRTLTEYLRIPALAREPERRAVEGVEHLRAAAAAGRGVVLVSAHYGNWEMIRLAAREAGVEVGIIYRAFNNDAFDRLALLRIRSAGLPVLHKGREGLRDLLGHLKRGGAVLVLMDQHLSGGTALPFLGRPALTLTAIPALCRRSGAVLLPAVARRRPDGRHFDVCFEPPVPADDPVAMTAAVNRRIEAWVEQEPGQWFWLHRRWRVAAPDA